MKKMLIIIVRVLLALGLSFGASAWIYVPDQGDTGWQTYTYTAGPGGFTGTAGFVVSNVIDNAAYSELLLDNLSQGGGGTNRGFEPGNLTGYDLVSDASELCQGQHLGDGNTVAIPITPPRAISWRLSRGYLTGVSTSEFSQCHRADRHRRLDSGNGHNFGPRRDIFL